MLGPILIFIIFLIFYSIASAILFYHLNEFGYTGDACRPMMAVYTLISIFIILTCIILLVIVGNFFPGGV